ncbi:MAG: hypothetical protein Q8P67_26530 [archaeon]|nr:hypothetical protein [archaeon]
MEAIGPASQAAPHIILRSADTPFFPKKRTPSDQPAQDEQQEKGPFQLH